jgi:hypothetical protein
VFSTRRRYVQLAAAVATAAVCMVVAPSALAATTRFAGPAGSGTDCTQSAPCALDEAVSLSADGDEVVVLPGDYGSPQAPLSSAIDLDTGVNVHGEDGQPVPRVFSSASNVFELFDAQAHLRRIDVEQSGSSTTGAVIVDPGDASQLIVHTSATGSPFGTACGVYSETGPALLSDSVCSSSADGVPAILETISGSGFALSSVIRNVTAVASGAGSAGLEARSGFGADLTVQATNVIARGGTTDVRASTSGSPAATVAVELDHSDYATVDPEGANVSITAPGTNGGQVAPPLFTNAPAGDFHELNGSPTIDAGVTDAANGPFDLDGDPRTLGAATDIGADEFVPLPPVQGGGPPPSAPTAPSLSSLALSNRVFAAARRGGSVARRVPVGTNVSYTLSEPARVTFTIARPAPGRRSGSRCVRPNHRNRSARRCTRWVRLRGSFARAGAAGRNRFRFTGRLRHKALAPGRYRLMATPADAGGRRGRTSVRQFRIVKR